MNSKTIGEIIGAGRTADVFEYGDNKVVKLFHKDVRHAYVEREYEISKMISNLSLSTPETYSIVELNGKTGIVYERIDGPTLLNIIISSPEVMDRYCEKLASLHIEIHSKEVVNFADGKERFLKRIINQEMLEDRTKEEILDYLYKLPDLKRLCHGDYHADNIIQHHEKLVIIDWVDAYQGYPLLDVARTYLLILTPYAKSLFDKSLALTIEKMQKSLAEMYLKYYFNLSQLRQEDFPKALRIVAAARLCEKVPDEQDWLLAIANNG